MARREFTTASNSKAFLFRLMTCMRAGYPHWRRPSDQFTLIIGSPQMYRSPESKLMNSTLESKIFCSILIARKTSFPPLSLRRMKNPSSSTPKSSPLRPTWNCPPQAATYSCNSSSVSLSNRTVVCPRSALVEKKRAHQASAVRHWRQ